MRLYVLRAVVALLVPYSCCRCAPDSGDAIDTLEKLLDARTITNRTDLNVPDYMYRIYEDDETRLYDLIRSVSPRTETLGARTRFIYDLSALKPTETVQKAVLQLEHVTDDDGAAAINVTLYSLARRTLSRTYLGSATARGNRLDLDRVLGSRSVNGIERLVVQTDCPSGLSSAGLVLYSTTSADGHAKGHELAKLMFRTATGSGGRSKRSVYDNEIDVKQKKPGGEGSGRKTNKKKTKKKRKKKKKNGGSRSARLQAVDNGDSIVFTSADQCRMEKLVLNFADIGWEDWVIYPKGFETNYCAGGCLFPLGKGSRPTNHATVQSLARSFGRLWDIPEPSCVPDTLAPLTLLYMDRSNHVLLKSYPDMRVVTCSCK